MTSSNFPDFLVQLLEFVLNGLSLLQVQLLNVVEFGLETARVTFRQHHFGGD